MKWASAISEQPSVESAIDECVASLRAQLGNAAPDLAVVFASSHFHQNYEAIPQLVRQALDRGDGAPLLLGCSGGGIIGNGQEVEQSPRAVHYRRVLARRYVDTFSPGQRRPAGPGCRPGILGGAAEGQPVRRSPVRAAGRPLFLPGAEPDPGHWTLPSPALPRLAAWPAGASSKAAMPCFWAAGSITPGRWVSPCTATSPSTR